MHTGLYVAKLAIGMIASKYNIPSTNLSVHEIKHRTCGNTLGTL